MERKVASPASASTISGTHVRPAPALEWRPLYVRSRLLGHATATTLASYSQVMPSMGEQAPPSSREPHLIRPAESLCSSTRHCDGPPVPGRDNRLSSAP